MSGWLTFAGVFALFFATHSIPVRPPVKKRLVRHLGAKGFTTAYSALSLCILALLIWAAGQAPFVLLWAEAAWHRPAILVGMLAACLILAASIGQPNPFSFGGRDNDAFDPTDCGIIGYMRHPLLSVLALWALLHVLANGDLAHVLLFGTLGLFAYVGPRIIDARNRRDMGAEAWEALVGETRRQRRIRVPSPAMMLRLGAGVILYLVLVFLHPVVIGVPVLS
ncbi:NnrU family protein [Roseobacter denitrificans]|uniref:NnrU protein, putative n=1 Tax=Roseobacter denitrificans (strain ATCC 33942 / OCh 114) TaxID=375451 RepID=Q169M4_ROSDO|nr:NnrU family protein [Roseobacter denitrificans]ABG31319.1 NnrU protein, putative [Roseobacter denitrificans OCh 114]AVL54354.1 NnrU family protein [Roseobacter denitrificans]SFF99461.1 Uncharacterized membrane protein [Roseobacter denitrificans OCh 114]